jgi:transposase
MNRVHKLSDEEIEAWQRLHRETDDADVRSRCDMALWSNDGLSPLRIAQRVRFSRRTVTRHIRCCQAEGLVDLFTRPRPGRPRRATTEYER